MAITMFTGSISAYAADHSKTAIKPKGIYSNLTITGWRSDNSKTNMYAKTTANYSTYRLAVTMVARNVDSKGNLKKTGGNPDKRRFSGHGLYFRRSYCRQATGGDRLCGGDAAGFADRFRHGDS